MDKDLEQDIWRSDLVLNKVRTRDDYAQNVYAAMCNMQWQKSDVWPVLKDELWSVTWRCSGGIVAELRGEGDYLSWYCSGMTGGTDYNDEQIALGYVSESVVTEEIEQDLLKLGWKVIYTDDE
mgnify:CR=1 FL=1